MKVDIREDKENGKVITTLEDLWFTYNGERMCVPAGFQSDGASVPRFLWSVLSPHIYPTTLESSVVHDFLYKWKIGTRFMADLWYFASLVMHGYGLLKNMLTFVGLRFFGKRWKKKKDSR